MLYVFDVYVLDTTQYTLQRAGQPIHLRPKAFQVLDYLLKHRDQVVWWWAGIIAAPLSGLVRVIILIILANIRAGFICLRVLNLSVVIIPTHYRLFRNRN
ncbi:hypothetical protein C2W62_40835 [Candidatus Entotheonella serta]|nr:hypothetical protein C2W62_40835 [Candidatus Entotheonella serta]